MIDFSAADMIEIYLSGGNGAEYVDHVALLKNALAEIQKLSQENTKLREALKPFAGEAERWVDLFGDQRAVYFNIASHNVTPDRDLDMSIGDLRRARTALGEKP